MKRLSQAFFLLAISVLALSLSVLSCGDGGGGGAAAAPAASGGATVHVSSVGPAETLSTTPFRIITLALAPGEIPVQFFMEGSYTTTATGASDIRMEVYADGVRIAGNTATPLPGSASNVPFQMLQGLLAAPHTGTWTYPSSSLSIRIYGYPPASGTVMINWTRVKVITVQGSVLDPSPSMVDS